MKKAVILFILLFFQFGYPCALRADSAVKIGVYNNPPLIFMGTDGTPKGIFADIIEYVAEKEHWQIEYVAGTFDQCLSRLAAHQIDLLCTVAYTDERAQRYDFTPGKRADQLGVSYSPPGVRTSVRLRTCRGKRWLF